MNADQLLNVTVVSPYEILFSGQAKSVSSKNSAGLFDILPQHANLITIIENSPIVIQKTDGEKISLSFPIAIIYNANDNVRIYTQLQFPKI